MLAEAKKAVELAITLAQPLHDFQEAIAKNPNANTYVVEMNTLLQGRCKDMMQEGMTWVTTDEEKRNEPSFTLSEVKNAKSDIIAKTRMLIYLCASRVSLQSGPENAVTTALMVAAWCVVPSCIHPNPGASAKNEDAWGRHCRQKQSLTVLRAESDMGINGRGGYYRLARCRRACARDTGRLQPHRAMHSRRYA